ncbi:MAG: LysR substrate-binding domain-containing protein [Pseudomonadota bacterium]
MNQATLRQLRYFDALARAGHFGRAADACAVSQPALSMQIKELEDNLGATLIERGARQVRLTRFGEVAVARAREILRAVDELGDLARASQDQMVGQLRVGVIPTVAPYLLPAVVARLADENPGLDIHVRETLTATLLRDLKDGRVDAAIVALPVSEPGLNEVALFKEAFVLVRPEADADVAVPNARTLARMKLLLLEEGHCFRDQALAFCKMASPKPREAFEVTSLSTLVQMVGAGFGVTLIPEMAVDVETRSAPVAVSRFRAPEPSRRIGMVWRKSSPLAEQLGQVAETVRAAAEGLRGSRS